MLRSAILPVLSLSAALLVSSAAHADEPAPLPAPHASSKAPASVDSVQLRNGDLFRGRVTEIVHGDHVTLVVEGGETKRIPWAEVDRLVVPSTGMNEAASGGAAAPVPAPPAPSSGPRARVHISSPRPVLLYRQPAGSTTWVQACSSPCDLELPIGDTYHVFGNGIATSQDFHLDANAGGSVDLHVNPSSSGRMIVGGVLGGVGLTASWVGLLMTFKGQANVDQTGCNDAVFGSCGSVKGGRKLRTAGLVTMAASVAMTVGGILLFHSGNGTDIVQSGRGGAAGTQPAQGMDAFLRTPTWKTVSTSDLELAAPAATLPFVVERTF